MKNFNLLLPIILAVLFFTFYGVRGCLSSPSLPDVEGKRLAKELAEAKEKKSRFTLQEIRKAQGINKVSRTEKKSLKSQKKRVIIEINLRCERLIDLRTEYNGINEKNYSNFFTCSQALQNKYNLKYFKSKIKYDGKVYVLAMNCSEADYFGDGESIGIGGGRFGMIENAKVEILQP